MKENMGYRFRNCLGQSTWKFHLDLKLVKSGEGDDGSTSFSCSNNPI